MPQNVKKVLISETMRLDPISYTEANGLWDGQGQRIIIKRNQLKNLESFAGTLSHEIAHATSGAGDASQIFEMELTKLLGEISAKKLKKSFLNFF